MVDDRIWVSKTIRRTSDGWCQWDVEVVRGERFNKQAGGASMSRLVAMWKTWRWSVRLFREASRA